MLYSPGYRQYKRQIGWVLVRYLAAVFLPAVFRTLPEAVVMMMILYRGVVHSLIMFFSEKKFVSPGYMGGEGSVGCVTNSD